MHFDIFHSVGRVDSVPGSLSDRQVFEHFVDQVLAAEKLGYETVWVAESHFSSEVQKSHRAPVIPNYQGEIGLNSDCMQLFGLLLERTERIGLGTAIHNIVGGNGGPIASADRVQMLTFLNQMRGQPRRLNIGVASGRFPYINEPFGVVPRNEEEERLWAAYRRTIFLEALEIFLRLINGETLSSDDVKIDVLPETDIPYRKRWEFQQLKLVPELDEGARKHLNIVLGSHDPLARDLAFSLRDVDVFNLSFTPAAQLNKIHQELTEKCQTMSRKAWSRQRLPRTVLVFVDKDKDTALARASACFDAYVEGMRGTVHLPPKDELMEKALIGTPEQLVEQMQPDNPRGYQADDRVMLWFEFNQTDNALIKDQMSLFAEEVAPHFR